MGALLSKKFPLFRWSGIQVNIHIMFLLFAGFEFWNLRETPGLALLFLAVVWGSVLLHEFGHCYGARYQGGDATEIVLWPLGGLALCDAPKTPWAQGFVAASGPIVNVVLGAIGWALWHFAPIRNERMYDVVGFHPGTVAFVLMSVNVGLFTFNMIPAFPMDMGRIYQALLWVWMGFQKSMRIACYTAFFCAAGMIVWSFGDRLAPSSLSAFVGSSLLFFIALWVAQTAFQELQLVNTGYYSELDEPWRQTFRYHPESEPRPREPGFIARWAAKREEEKKKKDAAAQEERAARLDAVLRRVAQVGMDGLTSEEKAFLEQESARLREKR